MTAAPLTIKPCRECGKPMECTPKREVCSVCRREKEKMYKRGKQAARLITEKWKPYPPAA
jgi:hypothetical protein